MTSNSFMKRLIYSIILFLFFSNLPIASWGVGVGRTAGEFETNEDIADNSEEHYSPSAFCNSVIQIPLSECQALEEHFTIVRMGLVG